MITKQIVIDYHGDVSWNRPCKLRRIMKILNDFKITVHCYNHEMFCWMCIELLKFVQTYMTFHKHWYTINIFKHWCICRNTKMVMCKYKLKTSTQKIIFRNTIVVEMGFQLQDHKLCQVEQRTNMTDTATGRWSTDMNIAHQSRMLI